MQRDNLVTNDRYMVIILMMMIMMIMIMMMMIMMMMIMIMMMMMMMMMMFMNTFIYQKLIFAANYLFLSCFVGNWLVHEFSQKKVLQLYLSESL
jgi:hypothetical protein